MNVRFLADMGISQASVEFLHGHGHEAVHLREEGLRRLPDDDILRKARDEKCVLLAHDLDFSDLVAAGSERLPSVVVFRLRDMRPDNVNRHLALLLDNHSEALEAGVIVSITEGRIRIRRLPIGGEGAV